MLRLIADSFQEALVLLRTYSNVWSRACSAVTQMAWVQITTLTFMNLETDIHEPVQGSKPHGASCPQL